MDVFTASFILCLLGFFFTHCFYFFNLNLQSRTVINFVNLFTLWIYIIYVSYFLLDSRIGLFESRDQHLLLLGITLLIIFTITDFFSGTKSLGLLFSIFILLLGTTGIVNIFYHEVIHSLTNLDSLNRLENFLLFLDQLAVTFLFIAVFLSILYHYSLIEVKYHRNFFFSNRFPGFDRLGHLIDGYLLSGTILTSISLFLSLKFNQEWNQSDLFNKMIGGVTILYYLSLLYIRYRRWFSSKLNLYWMLLSIFLLITKVGYWL